MKQKRNLSDFKLKSHERRQHETSQTAIKIIGKGSESRYLKWCGENKQAVTTNKTFAQFQMELEMYKNHGRAAWVEQEKKLRKHVLRSALNAAANKSGTIRIGAVSDQIAAFLARKRSNKEDPKIIERDSQRLIEIVSKLEVVHSPILKDRLMVEKIIGFVRQGFKWNADVKDWWPASHNAEKQLRSLFEYLAGREQSLQFQLEFSRSIKARSLPADI